MQTAPRSQTPKTYRQLRPSNPTWNSDNNRGLINNVNGDFNAGQDSQKVYSGPQHGEDLSQPQQSRELNRRQQPLGQEHSSLSTLSSIEAELRETRHSVTFFQDPEEWASEEDEYVHGTMQGVVSASSGTAQKLVQKVQRYFPKVYPRLFVYQLARIIFSGATESEITSKLQLLCKWHHNTCVPLGRAEYTQDSKADEIRDYLQTFYSAASVSAADEAEINKTIALLSTIDLVGVAVQRKLNSNKYRCKQDDEDH